jgi:hypothetical protein
MLQSYLGAEHFQVWCFSYEFYPILCIFAGGTLYLILTCTLFLSFS